MPSYADVTCIDCGLVRTVQVRPSRPRPARCAKCSGNGLLKGGLVGRREKKCYSCKRTLDANMFAINNSKHDKLTSQCKECARASARERYASNKDQWIKTRLSAYGLTISEYENLKLSQNDLCAICGNKCPTGKELAIDHCHRSGKVRGLLCTNCNMGIGRFKDDTSLLDRAISYLETFG